MARIHVKGRLALKSKNRCPGCGSNKWWPLKLKADGTLEDFSVCDQKGITIALVDFTVEDNEYLTESYDECINCGIAVR